MPGKNYKYQNSEDSTVTTYIPINDQINTLSIIPNIHYDFKFDCFANIMIVIPVYEKHSNQLSSTHKTNWKINLNIVKNFGFLASPTSLNKRRKKAIKVRKKR